MLTKTAGKLIAGNRSTFIFGYDTPPIRTSPTISMRTESGRLIARRVRPMCDSGVGGLGTDAQTFCPSTLWEASDPADCVETFTISAVRAYRLALALLALCAVVA